MENEKKWSLADFDYHLPAERIAQHPVEPRDGARLLVSREAGLEDRLFSDLPRVLVPGDLLVLNDTQVIPARLFGRKESGGRIEILLLRPVLAQEGVWEVLSGSNRPLRSGQRLYFGDDLQARVGNRQGVGWHLSFEYSQDSFWSMIERVGEMPLPPYIHATDKQRDRTRYQTVFARHRGAVAAPTAGLHFTPELLEKLAKMGIGNVCLTLHVGLGTFQPVREGDLSQHHMHAEWFHLSEETAQQVNATRHQGGRVIAVGTTAARALESSIDSQGVVQATTGETNLFILPGFHFHAVDALITNFHLPKSTLLMLVAAFIGKERLDRDYAHAVAQGYRFYSYGDASLLLKK
ncbi:MAG: tRNA preQ1(34) S-adenosylmethionine ribosyltransferase-isomerase QueA [Magnetococcus sp. DMHC-6]